MINKENNNIKKLEPEEDSGILDVAKMDVQCHVLIKDKDTDEVLVNKRG